MKTLVRIMLPLCIFSATLCADNGDCLEMAVCEMNELHRGCASEDGIFNAISSSMVGWGVGLFVGIALLTGLIHNSHTSHKDTPSSNNSSN